MHEEVLDEKRRAVFAKLSQFPDFYLSGGTALAFYLGHRISVDFDLFSSQKIPRDLLEKIEKVYQGSSVLPSVNNPDELTVFINSVKTTFLFYPFPVVLGFTEYQGIQLSSVKEIAATKAYALGRRVAYRDYIDLYFVLAERHATLSEIIEIAERKYAENFNSRLFLEQLVDVEEPQDTSLIFLKGEIGKAQMEQLFRNAVSEIKID
ncbi:MAG: nucleotidyl transferase AbiEii/AbiGii toxin family protein [bacterium]|nr:nucleotidyl transferase AbiEii/AbiGii toxin family protein [bacterium]